LSNRAAKRREIADKLSGDIARLRKEIENRREHLLQAKERTISKRIAKAYVEKSTHVVDRSWFTTWSRHAPALARAVGSLDRCLKRLPIAVDKAEIASMLAREERDRLAHIKAANEGYDRQFEAFKKDTTNIDARWRKEREGEEKRIRTRQKQLLKRTTKDYSDRAEMFRKPVSLPPPVEQPDLSSHHEEMITTPPREGLIPGTFTVMDPARAGRLIDRPRTPKVWTASYVGARLIEAHKILMRLPGSIWPKGYGAAWPVYKVEAGEAAIQAGAGTLAIGRHSRPRTASADAVARMTESISWPMQFLANRKGAAADVNYWAADAAWDQMDFDSRNAPWVELQIIADALNAAKEVVR